MTEFGLKTILVHAMLLAGSDGNIGAPVAAANPPPDPVAIKLSVDNLPLEAQNEEDFAARAAETANRLITTAQDAENRGQLRVAFEAYLTAANWILAYQIEPMASRLLLDAPLPSDPKNATLHVSRARAQLARAASIWKKIENDTNQVDDEETWRLTDRLESLQGFANAFQAIWRTDYAGESQRDEALSIAAGGLSIAREDERESVAAGAQLWQAYLYAARGKHERAADLLPDAVTEPDGAKRFGFFARVLRCRLMARAYHAHSASISLLARLEERATKWFVHRNRVQEAQRVAALARRRVLSDWAKALREEGLLERAKWCERAIAEIDVDYFSPNEPVSVLRLHQAAPAVVSLELAAKEQSDEKSGEERGDTGQDTESPE